MMKIDQQLPRFRRECGVTLIELLVAMVISLFMIGAVLYVVEESRVTYRHNDSLGRIQESGRIAIEIVAYDSRMAGYFGCTPARDQVVVKANPPPTPSAINRRFTTVAAMEGLVYPSADANVYVNEGSLLGVPGSDVILLRKGGNNPESLSVAMGNEAAAISIADNTDNIAPGDLVMITDCSAGDVFTATAVGPGAGGVVIGHAAGAGNLTGVLSKQYGQDANVMRFSQEVYYLRDTGRTMPNGGQIFSLFRRDAGNLLAPIQELIEGVTNMVVTYGLDVDEDRRIDQYVTAAAVPPGAWGQVLSARIEVLVASDAGIARETQPYYFNGVTVTPPPVGGVPDRTLRQSFSATAAFRNLLQ